MPNCDRFVTRLVPLNFIDAEAITNTIKPLISKDASLVAYQPTNTIIVTDSESNIRRLLSILAALDVESYRQELAVIKVEYADANTLAEQLSGSTARKSPARAGERPPSAGRAPPTQLERCEHPSTGTRAASVPPSGSSPTSERTLAGPGLPTAARRHPQPRPEARHPGDGDGSQPRLLPEARRRRGARKLNSLVGSSGGGAARTSPLSGAASNNAATRATVTPLDDGITVTVDPATNALVIKASKEGYETLKQVIEQLDISRPQVLVEALIVEVDVTDSLSLGFDAAFRSSTATPTSIYRPPALCAGRQYPCPGRTGPILRG